ncbi:hypothetical protein FQR65_LT11117 [Abscondita terminalis]|nr:hypothetical protein FQR65_LT11117 [Abscondita terminalis]
MSGCGQNVLFFTIAFVVPLVFGQPPTVLPLDPKAEESTKNADKHIQLLPFMELAHGLSSGTITVLESKRFLIENLHYDGKGPDAHFWVGKGSWPDDNGILVPDENGSELPLREYNGRNLTITLPGALIVDDIDYLGVWCIKFKHNFGHTYTKTKDSDTYVGVQLEPLKQLGHGLRSDPIIVVDEKTIFVPNLHYDGKGPDAHFWVGKGILPSASGLLVPDETGSSRSLSAYTGQSVYITLPNNVKVKDFDYFGVWCIKHNQNFGHVIIPNNITVPKINGNPKYTFDNKEIIRVKKCCRNNEVLTSTGCGHSEQKFNLSVNVHTHNITHIDDEPMRNVVFVPFVQPITCEFQKYPLDPNEDSFPLLKNGSLAVLNSQTDQILSMDNYCFESVNFGDAKQDNWVTTAILCFNSATTPVSDWIFYLYAVGVLVSAIFLILTALVFWRFKVVRDTRGKCIMVYSISMAIAFICLVIAQFSELNQNSCTITAYVIQLALVSSFTWLTMVSCETLCKILFHDTEAYERDRRRLWVYVGIGVLVPILTLGISLVIDLIPDIPTSVLKPEFGQNSCWFDQNKTSSIYFYVPIGVAILCNVCLAAVMKWKLIQCEKKPSFVWNLVQKDLKPMFRSCLILTVVMSLCWIMEMVSYFMNTGENIWKGIDIINSLQGLFVFVIFVTHRPVNNKLAKTCQSWRRMARRKIKKDRIENDIPLDETENRLMENLKEKCKRNTKLNVNSNVEDIMKNDNGVNEKKYIEQEVT